MEVIWVKPETKYFCKRGWTAKLAKHEVICPSGRFAHTQHGLSPARNPSPSFRTNAPSRNDGVPGLLRGACHRARIRATRWLAMTGKSFSVRHSGMVRRTRPGISRFRVHASRAPE